jgi:hypothetical protein
VSEMMKISVVFVSTESLHHNVLTIIFPYVIFLCLLPSSLCLFLFLFLFFISLSFVSTFLPVQLVWRREGVAFIVGTRLDGYVTVLSMTSGRWITDWP